MLVCRPIPSTVRGFGFNVEIWEKKESVGEERGLWKKNGDKDIYAPTSPISHTAAPPHRGGDYQAHRRRDAKTNLNRGSPAMSKTASYTIILRTCPVARTSLFLLLLLC